MSKEDDRDKQQKHHIMNVTTNKTAVAPTESEQAAKAQAKQRETDVASLGQGKYSASMKELYQDSQRVLGLSRVQALKLAVAFGAEMGNLEKAAREAGKDSTLAIKIGKLTKDRMIPLKESTSIVYKTGITSAISLAKLTVEMDNLRQYGLVVGKDGSDIVLTSTVTNWLAGKANVEDTTPDTVTEEQTQEATV